MRPRSSGPLPDILHHLLCLWLLHPLWLLLAQDPPAHLLWLGDICASGNTYYSPSFKSCVSIARDMNKNQFSLQLSSVTPEDTAAYYCVRDTVRGSQGEPRHKPAEKGWAAGVSRATRGRSGLKGAQGPGRGQAHKGNPNSTVTNPHCTQSDCGHHTGVPVLPSFLGHVHGQVSRRDLCTHFLQDLTLPAPLFLPSHMEVKVSGPPRRDPAHSPPVCSRRGRVSLPRSGMARHGLSRVFCQVVLGRLKNHL